MNERVKCLNCGYPHIVNPSKHERRIKYCVKCRTVIVAEVAIAYWLGRDDPPGFGG